MSLILQNDTFAPPPGLEKPMFPPPGLSKFDPPGLTKSEKDDDVSTDVGSSEGETQADHLDEPLGVGIETADETFFGLRWLLVLLQCRRRAAPPLLSGARVAMTKMPSVEPVVSMVGRRGGSEWQGTRPNNSKVIVNSPWRRRLPNNNPRSRGCGVLPQPAETPNPWGQAAANPLPARTPLASTFDLVTFHWDLTRILRDLAVDPNVSNAAARVRAHHVPKEHQAAEYTNILTRASEEKYTNLRRLCFAFAGALANNENSVFEKSECIEGVRMFFHEVYGDLCSEMPELPKAVANELVPVLRSVLPAAELHFLVPTDLKTRFRAN